MTDLFELGWVAVLGGCAALALAAFAHSRPRSALVVSYLLLAVAGTKFRLRSPTDSLTGQMDWQIGLELALYAFVALIVVMSAVSGQTPRRRLAPVELLLVGFAVLALISTFWSTAPLLTLVRALQMMIVCGLALTSVRLLGPADTLRGLSVALVIYVLGCAAIAAVFGTVELDPALEAGVERAFRFTWFAVHPILAGIYAAMAALLVLTRCLCANQPVWKWKLLPGMIVISLIVILVLTNSRGPLLAFLAAAGLVVWKTIRRGFARGLIAATAVLVLAVTLSGDAIRSLVEPRGDEESILAQRILRGRDAESLRGLNGRFELWEAAAPLVYEQPLFGYGYHGARALLFERVSWGSYAHSAYVQSLLDFGFLGALLIWGVIGSVFVRLAFRPLGAVTGTVWCDASLTGIAAFILVISISSESFLAAPDYAALLVFLVVSVVGQSKSSVVGAVRRPQLHRAPRLSAARRSRWSARAAVSG